MNKTLAGSTLAAFLAGIAAGTQLDAPPPASIGDVVNVGESKAVFLPGGQKIYVAPTLQADGGDGVALLPSAPCARKPTPEADCKHRADVSGTATGPVVYGLVDPPVGNRYPIADMVGVGCEGVACSVVEGADPLAPEVAPP